MPDETRKDSNEYRRADQPHGLEPPHEATPGQLAAFWARMDAKGQASMDALEAADLSPPVHADAAGADEPSWAKWDAKVACLSNTPPQSSAVAVPGFPDFFATVGIDWWEWVAWATFDRAAFIALTIKLDALKKMCQEQRISDAWVFINGVPSFRVCRTGFNRGGDRGQYFDYKNFYCGIAIGIANRDGGKEGLPNIYVVQRGSDCLRMGALNTQDKIRTFLRWLGATITQERLSRADICLDVPNLDVRTFQPFIQNRQFVSKAKLIQPYENAVTEEWTGFVVGKRPMRIVVYDKVRELARKQDELYLRAMIERRWGGQLPKCASRIEIQITREWLRKFGIESPDDFIRKGSDIIQRQIFQWFRLTTERVESEKKTQGRLKTDPLWLALCTVMVNWFGRPEGDLKPIDRTKVIPIRAIRQGIGHILSALHQQGYVMPRFSDLYELVRIQIEKAYPTHDERVRFVEEYRCRSTEYQG